VVPRVEEHVDGWSSGVEEESMCSERTSQGMAFVDSSDRCCEKLLEWVRGQQLCELGVVYKSKEVVSGVGIQEVEKSEGTL
jgi:hypothetical protein